MHRIIEKLSRKRNPREYSAFPSEQKSPPRQKIVIFLIFVTVGSLGLGGYYFMKYQKLKNAPQNANVASEDEAKDLEKKVSRLMVLPEGELPTIATISDKAQLKDQPFFNNSTDGDKLLIYSQAKIAVLYSPKSDKIINVGPLTVENQSGTATKPTETPLHIALYNGTTNSGLTAKTEEQLKSRLINPIFSQTKQAKQNYTKTKVIALAGNNEKNATEVAELLEGEVSELPEGEITPKDTDILVIIGE